MGNVPGGLPGKGAKKPRKCKVKQFLLII